MAVLHCCPSQGCRYLDISLGRVILNLMRGDLILGFGNAKGDLMRAGQDHLWR
jgi:hypothetical protein